MSGDRWRYRCSALRAWISTTHCQRFAAWARASLTADPGSLTHSRGMAYRECCPGCPGVRRRSALDGTEPRHVNDFRPRVPRERQPSKPRRQIPNVLIESKKRKIERLALAQEGPE